MSSPSVRERGRLLLLEAATGPLLVGGAIGLVIAIAVSGMTKLDGTSWPDRTTLAPLVCLFTAPLLAGAVCLQVSGRSSGLGDVARTSASGRYFPARTGWAAGSLWGVVIAAAQILSSTLVRLPLGEPFTLRMLLPWLLCVLLLLAAAAIGAVIGAHVEGFGWSAVVALGIFSWLYGTVMLDGTWWWSLLAPLDASTYFAPYKQPGLGPLLLHSGACVAVLAGVGAALARRTRWKAPLVASSVVALAVAIGAGVYFGPSRIQSLPLTEPPVCEQRDQTTLCVWPMMGDVLEPQLRVLARARSLAAEYWAAPAVFAQDGLPASVEGQLIYIADVTDPEILADEAMFAVLPQCDATPEGEQASADIAAWFSARVTGQWWPDSVEAMVMDLPESEQAEWVEETLRAGGCR